MTYDERTLEAAADTVREFAVSRRFASDARLLMLAADKIMALTASDRVVEPEVDGDLLRKQQIEDQLAWGVDL